MVMKKGAKPTLAAALLAMLLTGPAFLPVQAAEQANAPKTYSAQFRDTDINEFISTVAAVLKKTIVVDPAVRGKIDVRSYEQMTAKEYYQFFQNVLDVYGYAVITMPNGVLKVVKAKDAKTGAIPVVDAKLKHEGGDEMITRVFQVHNVAVRELSPLLRQLVDNAGAGNVVHYDDSNVLIVTGRSGVVDRIGQIIKRVDKAGDQEVTVVKLKYASASQVVSMVNDLIKGSSSNNNNSSPLSVKVVADDRTNSVLVSGETKARDRIIKTIRDLDTKEESTGNTRVVYLKYANAKDLVETLTGVSKAVQADSKKGEKAGGSVASNQDVSIKADEGTNALVLTGQPDMLNNLTNVINKLDIRRAQVHVEAMIVELYDGNGTDLGVQWYSSKYGAQQFSNGSTPSLTTLGAAYESATQSSGTTTTTTNTDGSITQTSTSDSSDYSDLASALGGVNGALWGVFKGNWGALVNAVSSDTKANILSTPSVTTLDNKEASFVSGEDVPIITGSTTSSSSSTSNPFQTVQREQLGVKLDVTPQINKGDAVQLTIKQEVSNVSGNTSVDITLQKRQVNTTVMVHSGDTIVLGGLIDEETQESVEKVPLLGDIPWIGNLFKSTSSTKKKRKLMVFIHPTIVRDDKTMRDISREKYNLVRDEQVKRQEEGISLMPFMDAPEIPPWDDSLAQPPSLTEYIRDRDGKEGQPKDKDQDD
ncbi:type II secretion system secretin GspD [Gallaecimonas mangrovi]|uniref:type II secretion system secretin GspD n=1 Tax=Gallaecimonas mangrovi TaxID=2291597 RepID=UPI001D00D965|nr:type II secretion system secretin GspD [Gallaecimonas mangrovi]